MKKLILLLLMLSFSAVEAQVDTFFEAGNEAYAEGDYQEALDQYNKILEAGKTSAALHYNLGNAHYKLNHIAPSIYHFEKALQLDPGDQEIRNNLQFARKMAIDAIEEEGPGGFQGLLDKATGVFSLTGWAWAGVTLMILFVMLILAYYFSRRSVVKRVFFIFGVIFFISSGACVLIGFLQLREQMEQDYAIIFSEKVEVMAEPSGVSSEVLELHEGTKIRVTEDFQEWLEIELPNGTQGWIRKEDVKRL